MDLSKDSRRYVRMESPKYKCMSDFEDSVCFGLTVIYCNRPNEVVNKFFVSFNTLRKSNITLRSTEHLYNSNISPTLATRFSLSYSVLRVIKQKTKNEKKRKRYVYTINESFSFNEKFLINVY